MGNSMYLLLFGLKLVHCEAQQEPWTQITIFLVSERSRFRLLLLGPKDKQTFSRAILQTEISRSESMTGYMFDVNSVSNVLPPLA